MRYTWYTQWHLWTRFLRLHYSCLCIHAKWRLTRWCQHTLLTCVGKVKILQDGARERRTLTRIQEGASSAASIFMTPMTSPFCSTSPPTHPFPSPHPYPHDLHIHLLLIPQLPIHFYLTIHLLLLHSPLFIHLTPIHFYLHIHLHNSSSSTSICLHPPRDTSWPGSGCAPACQFHLFFLGVKPDLEKILISPSAKTWIAFICPLIT